MLHDIIEGGRRGGGAGDQARRMNMCRDRAVSLAPLYREPGGLKALRAGRADQGGGAIICIRVEVNHPESLR